MKILIDIGHPGHVHLFRPFAQEMIRRGHKILFTCREKEFEKELLEVAGFDYISFGKKYKSTTGKILGLVKFDVREFKAGLKFKPDIFLSHGSPYAAHASFLLGKPHISLEDTGNMEQIRLYKPFTNFILVSSAFHKNLGKKQIIYNGYHELAYLHPNYFKPNEEILKRLKINPEQKYVVVRFVSWNATHDTGEEGLSLNEKNRLISLLESYNYKIFISAEGVLPAEFEKYRISISPSLIHHVLAFASLFIGEGATMASECAMLGTPAIYVNSMEAGTIDEQERYGLLFHFRNGMGVIEKVKELLIIPNLKEEWQMRRERMLKNKIDVTAFMVWFVEKLSGKRKNYERKP